MSREAPEQQMPTSEAPANENQQGTAETGEEVRADAAASSSGNGTANGAGGGAIRSTSRWIDYDTHELLDMISALEDERRWARLREGVLWAILAHLVLLFALVWVPTHLYPKVIDPFDAIKERKDLSYLDLPPDALRATRPKETVKPLKQEPLIDKRTMEEMKRESEEAPKPATPPPPVEQKPEEQPAKPSQPIPPTQQSQVEAPRPAPVPARPNFAQLEQNQNPANQLQQEMRNAMPGHGPVGTQAPAMGGLPMHPGAGTGGVQILSDTQGVDFNAWLAAWYYETRRTWDPLIPDECNPPISKQGQVLIDFKVLPNGRLMDGSETLVGRSGDTALDRAAWGALSGSSYPPLPKEFHGPYIELRAWFLYNMQPTQ